MLRWSARIAAVVIVAISFGFLFKNYQYEKSACQQTITVPAGQRAQITLADGTKVWLNSKSTLTYASNFGRKERNVELVRLSAAVSRKRTASRHQQCTDKYCVCENAAPCHGTA